MRFKLIESVLIEGKNKERTFEQYKDKLFIKTALNNGATKEDIDNLPKEKPYLDTEAEKVYDFLLTNSKLEWEQILKLDPTYNEESFNIGTYGIWLTNQYIKGNNLPDNTKEILIEFMKKSPNLKNKDINSYKSIEDVQEILQKTKLPRKQERKDKSDINPIFFGKDWTVYEPRTYEANLYLGGGTGWCTAHSAYRDVYDSYTEDDNKLYVIYSKYKPYQKYQFSWQTEEFCGAGTNTGHWNGSEEYPEQYEINPKGFFDDNPELKQFFNSLHLNTNIERPKLPRK